MTNSAGIPGYVAGEWSVDTANSEAGFTVRHLGVAKVHGRFNVINGRITTGRDVEESAVSATIEANTINTGYIARDEYIRGEDVLRAGEYKELSFRSTGVQRDREQFRIAGELILCGVARPVTLDAELGGFGKDPVRGTTVLGVSATTTIRRTDFGLCPKIPPAVVGEVIELRLDIQATLDAA